MLPDGTNPEGVDPEPALGWKDVFRKRAEYGSLKTLTSLNKEVRSFFLSDNSIWSFPLFLPLAIAAFGAPEGYFSLAIIAFGAC